MTFQAPHDLDLALTAYGDHLRAPNSDYIKDVYWMRGSRYLRTVTVSTGGSRSSHSFIVIKDHDGFRCGDILKAASWKAPARNFIRGNVFNPESYRHHKCYGL